jgi:hypothetical protein
MAAENILVIAISRTRPERDVRKIPAKSSLLFMEFVDNPNSDKLSIFYFISILFL